MAEHAPSEDGLVARGLEVLRGRRVVLEDVSLNTKRGEMLAIIGPNGAGKSTLLKALAGLLEYEGSVELDGRSVRQLSSRERASLISYVPQRSLLRSALRVEEVVAHGRYAYGLGFGGLSKRDATAVDQALATARASALAGRRFTELSVGEQQRVLIARALATEAPYLLLDEPTAVLDVGQALATFALLERLAEEGRSVVMVVHSLDDARRFAKRCLLLQRGKVVAEGPVDEVIRPDYVRDVYQVEMREDAGLRFEAKDD